eukprot:5916120-Lingulodinium_polyedra.AAC.1
MWTAALVVSRRRRRGPTIRAAAREEEHSGSTSVDGGVGPAEPELSSDNRDPRDGDQGTSSQCELALAPSIGPSPATSGSGSTPRSVALGCDLRRPLARAG